MALRTDGARGVIFALAGLASGCATPEVSRGHSAATDPACLVAESPLPATLGAALIEDPPIPGRSMPGWPGRASDDTRPPKDGAHMLGDKHHEHTH